MTGFFLQYLAYCFCASRHKLAQKNRLGQNLNLIFYPLLNFFFVGSVEFIRRIGRLKSSLLPQARLRIVGSNLFDPTTTNKDKRHKYTNC